MSSPVRAELLGVPDTQAAQALVRWRSCGPTPMNEPDWLVIDDTHELGQDALRQLSVT